MYTIMSPQVTILCQIIKNSDFIFVLKILSPCLFAVSPPQSVLLFHDNICRIALVLAHYSSLLVRTLPGVRTGKSTTSRTVQQPTKVKAWPAMMLLFLLHLTMVCAITCYILLWLMLPHNMFDCGLHMVACATTHHIWLWLVLHSPYLVVAACHSPHLHHYPPVFHIEVQPSVTPQDILSLLLTFFKLPSFQTFPQIHIARIKLVVCN